MEVHPLNFQNNMMISEQVLEKEIISSLILLGLKGECVYSYGDLKSTFEGEGGQAVAIQLLELFLIYDEQKDVPKMYEKKLLLNGKQFFIFHASPSSVYATTFRKRHGLIINRLPFGVMLTAYSKPREAHQVAPIVEKFADMLKT